MIIQEKFITDLLSRGKRIDGRKADEVRKIVIERNPSEKAEGSAFVTYGKTKVVAGVKLGMGEPFQDKPDEGVLITSAEFSPISSPEFEPGPPSDDSIEVARVVDRGIRESGMIDMKKMCIEKGEKVWMVNVDIQILDNFGNLIDAAALASTVAILEARFPKVEDGTIVYGEKSTKKLPVKYKPIAITLGKIGDHLVVDPDREEEKAEKGRLTITTRDDGNVCAIQKGGRGALSIEDIEKALDLAVEKGAEIRAMLK